MSEYVVDSKGRKHKLLSKKVDLFSFMGLKVFEDLVYNYLKPFVSEETYKKLNDLTEEIYQEIGMPEFEEFVDDYAVLLGYNRGVEECEKKKI